MRNLLIVSVVVAMLCVSPAALATDGKPDPKVVQKIEQGLKAYKDGKPTEATAALQEAMTMIQKANASGLEAFFPDAPAGWEAGKVSTQTMNMAGQDGAISFTALERRYDKKDDKKGQSISMTLLSSPEMVANQKQMIDALSQPQMIAMFNTDGNTAKAISQDGWAGLLRAEKGGDGQILLFHGTTMLNIQGQKTDTATLEAFLKKVNLKGLAAQDKTGAAPAKPTKKAEK